MFGKKKKEFRKEKNNNHLHVLLSHDQIKSQK